MEFIKMSPNDSFQIHNYSFAAIEAFVLEVKKYPILYSVDYNNENSECMNIQDFCWSKIVRTLLERVDYFLTPSQRVYWERIYRGLWVWMRHVLTRDMQARSNGHFGLSQNDKYRWLEYLKFLEPFIHLSGDLFNGYKPDLDPCIHMQIMTSEEAAQSVYCQYIVHWTLFQEAIDAKTFYISICVHAVFCNESIHNSNSELEEFLEGLNNTEIPTENIIMLSPIYLTNSTQGELNFFD